MKDAFRVFRKVLHEAPMPVVRKGDLRDIFDEPRRLYCKDLKRLFPFLSANRHSLILSLVFLLLGTLTSLPQPLFPKYLFDNVVPQRNMHLLYLLVGAIGATVICGAVLNYLQSFYLLRFQQSVLFDMQRRLFGLVLHLPKAFFDSKHTGYLLSRVGSDVLRLQSLFSGSILIVVPSIMKLTGGVVFLLMLNTRLALIAFSILPAIIVIAQLLGKRVRLFSRAAMEHSALVFRDLQQSLSAVAVIKMFSTEAREQEKLEARLATSIECNLEQSVVSSVSGSLSSIVISLGMALILFVGAKDIMSGRMTLGAYISFTAFLAYIYGPAQSIVSTAVMLQASFAALERVFQLFDLVREDAEDDGKISVLSLKGEIEFEGVSFSYDGRTEVLHDVSFRVQPGQMVAIVGPSGAGKSTLVNLVIQLYRPAAGRILLDGNPVSALNLRSVRERIGIVSQEVFLFDATISDNIRYARPEASDAEVMRAASMAGADEFIAHLSDGYKTRVGERGTMLSLGQRQRISLARAMLKCPDVIILDEPTSALDSVTEACIKAKLAEFTAGHTTFVIAHRLSTVVVADDIIVLDNGRIVQRGTHGELIDQKGIYQSMCVNQFLARDSVVSADGRFVRTA